MRSGGSGMRLFWILMGMGWICTRLLREGRTSQKDQEQRGLKDKRRLEKGEGLAGSGGSLTFQPHCGSAVDRPGVGYKHSEVVEVHAL
ncbi:hypothetical protein GCM10027262_10890 [Nocardia tengchongensis]